MVKRLDPDAYVVRAKAWKIKMGQLKGFGVIRNLSKHAWRMFLWNIFGNSDEKCLLETATDVFKQIDDAKSLWTNSWVAGDFRRYEAYMSRKIEEIIMWV